MFGLTKSDKNHVFLVLCLICIVVFILGVVTGFIFGLNVSINVEEVKQCLPPNCFNT